jgi:hypothetical protein
VRGQTLGLAVGLVAGVGLTLGVLGRAQSFDWKP